MWVERSAQVLKKQGLLPTQSGHQPAQAKLWMAGSIRNHEPLVGWWLFDINSPSKMWL